MRLMIYICLVIITWTSSLMAVNQSDIDFYYKSGQYQQALDVYKTLLQKRYNDPVLLYNIGNVYYKLEKYGFAMAYYQHALKLNPYDTDLKANITLLKSKIIQSSDVKEETNRLFHYLFFRGISINHSFLLFYGFFMISIILMGWRLYKKQPVSVVGYSLFIVTVIFFGVFSVKYYDIEMTKRGVVLSDKSSVYSGPSEVLSVLFLLDEGSNFQLIKEQENWVEIVLENGFRGWLKRSDFYMY